MRSIHGFVAIILCFILFGPVSLAGAEETEVSEDPIFSDWGEQISGVDTGGFNIENLLDNELVSGIIQFLISLFLSLFSASSA